VQKLRIGSVAPDFEADTTQGHIRFYDYIGNGWATFFCYPDDFTPVATTELVIFSFLQKQFAERNTKLIAMSTNNRPTAHGDKYVSHKKWIQDINDISPTPMDFPIIQDKEGLLSRLYNVLDESDVENISGRVDVTTGLAFKSRTIYIIGPLWKGKHHVRLAFKYPAAVGVSPEVLRAVDALQTADSTGTRMPANWIPGGDVVIPPSMSDDEAKEKFPDLKVVKPYLRLTELPAKKGVPVETVYFLKGSLVSMGQKLENGQLKVQTGASEYSITA